MPLESVVVLPAPVFFHVWVEDHLSPRLSYVMPCGAHNVWRTENILPRALIADMV